MKDGWRNERKIFLRNVVFYRDVSKGEGSGEGYTADNRKMSHRDGHFEVLF